MPVSLTPTATPPGDALREHRHAALARVPHRVVHEVGQHLPQRGRVGPDVRRVRCDLEAQLDVLCRADLLDRRERIGCQRAHIDPDRFGFQPPDSIRDRSSRSSTMRCMRARVRLDRLRRTGGAARQEAVVEQRFGEAADRR